MNKFTFDYIPNFSSKSLNTASIKPRLDTIRILKQAGYTDILPRYNSKPKLGKIIAFFQFIWVLCKISKESILFIQYPFQLQGFNFVLKFFIRHKNLLSILLIHDSYILRNPYFKNIEKKELAFFRYFDHVICHNEKMKNYLRGKLDDNIRLYELGIFDYLVKKDDLLYEKKKLNEHLKIVIAGNLGRLKFLGQLGKIKKVDFYLYGPGFDDQIVFSNVHYCGSVHPDILDKQMTQYDFGLVWDGISIDSLNGTNDSEYMKYNNPYKLSATISSGIPVITSRQAGISKFVQEEQIGILVQSLEELNVLALSSIEYSNLLFACEKIKNRINTGWYLRSVLSRITCD
jgi:hypothetical protein